MSAPRWNIPGVIYPDEGRKGTRPQTVNVETVLRLRSEGLLQRQIAAELGVTQSAISYVLIRRGVRSYQPRKQAA